MQSTSQPSIVQTLAERAPVQAGEPAQAADTAIQQRSRQQVRSEEQRQTPQGRTERLRVQVQERDDEQGQGVMNPSRGSATAAGRQDAGRARPDRGRGQ